MSICIRNITPDDAAAFRAVLDVVARERQYLALTEAPPPEMVEAFVANNIRRGHPQLVALAEGRIVGWCDVVVPERPTLVHIGSLGIGLLPDFRGQGIGERLLRQTIEAARSAGLVRLQLTVYVHNERARALYRKVGFVEEGLQRAAVRIDGRLIDAVMMAMIFDVPPAGERPLG